MIAWTPAAKARLCELWLTGTTPASQIAVVLADEHGIRATKSAVIGVAFRAGLAFQGSRANAASPAERAAVKARRAAQRREQRARVAKPAPAPKPAPAAKRVPTGPVGIPESLRISIVEIRDGQCLFIEGDPRAPGAPCCGHPTVSGGPWCAGHHALCTTPATARAGAYLPSSRRVA